MIAIIDYEMGNLRSVQKALERVGHAAVITSDPAVLADATKIVLAGRRGVSRCDCGTATSGNSWSRFVPRRSIQAKPFLGICLGLQMLFDKGYEDGEHEGLGILPGEVVRFKRAGRVQSAAHGVEPSSFRRRPPIFEGIEDGEHFYFVHSYYVVPRD